MEQKAIIIETDDGKRVWFAAFDILEESDNGQPDPLKIEAYYKEGQLCWKDGVYEDGYYRGKTGN